MKGKLKMEHYKRLLVLSHNCLSKSGSNGRTLRNYLCGWPVEKIAQLYIHSEKPDFECCQNYFCLTDASVAKSILNRKTAGTIVSETIGENKKDNRKTRKLKKNSLIYLIREFMWRSRLWNRRKMNEWISTFDPEIILVQAGDAGFLFGMALDISCKYNAPIVIYNTEGYYFKKKSYLPENKLSNLFYPLLNRYFKAQYKRLAVSAKVQIYNCELLKKDYEKEIPGNHMVVMNASEFTDEIVSDEKNDTIVYAGNLGLLRHRSLIEFAAALQSVNPQMSVDVYGNMPNEQVKKELEQCAGIHLHGFVAYEELQPILKKSSYLLHVESFDSFYREDLRYAFSTKIADSLAVGACLFVYAPDNMAVVQYLDGKEAAVVVTDSNALKETIKNILQNENLRLRYGKNARCLAERNHNLRINREKFQNIL